MKLKAFVQKEESAAEDFKPVVLSVDDIEDLMEKIIEAKEQAEEAGYSFCDDMELLEEENGLLKLVSHSIDSEDKMVISISNFGGKVDQDSVRDYLVAN